jgi:hypothetical protein
VRVTLGPLELALHDPTVSARLFETSAMRTADAQRRMGDASKRSWSVEDPPRQGTRRLLIGHPVIASTAAGRGPRLLARRRAKSRPAPPGGGEVPRAATGKAPDNRHGKVVNTNAGGGLMVDGGSADCGAVEVMEVVWPSGAALRGEASNHLQVHWLKTVVLNVVGKGATRSRQVWVGRMSDGRKSSARCRKPERRRRNQGRFFALG